MTDPQQPAARKDGRFRSITSAYASNRVLRNTCVLLTLTLAFSASCVGMSMGLDLGHPSLMVTLAGYCGLLFLTTKFRESVSGLGFAFALTGFIGYTLDPILSGYLALSSGPWVVLSALGGAAALFISLSAFAVTAPRPFSFAGAVLLGTSGAIVAGLGAVFFELTGLVPAVFTTFVLLMSVLILCETRNILRSNETNYIMATVTLYVAMLSLFTSSLHLVGSLDSDE